jgi:hypothetical protein
MVTTALFGNLTAPKLLTPKLKAMKLFMFLVLSLVAMVISFMSVKTLPTTSVRVSCLLKMTSLRSYILDPNIVAPVCFTFTVQCILYTAIITSI